MASFHTTRTKSGRGPLGCLIPLIAATILLAAGVTFISWFALDNGDLEPGPPTSISRPSSSSKPSAPSKHAERTPSIAAIIEVIESDGFVEFGVPESIDLGSQRQVTHRFRRDQHEISMTIYTYKSAQKVHEKLSETSDKTSALSMGNRVITLDSPARDAQAMLPVLTKKLETYQKFLDDE